MPHRLTDRRPPHPPARRYPLGSLLCDDVIVEIMKARAEGATVNRHLSRARLHASQLRYELALLVHDLRRAEALLTAAPQPSAQDMPGDLLMMLDALADSLDACRTFLSAWAESETCLVTTALEKGHRHG